MHEYVSVLLIIVILIIFTLVDAQMSPNFNVLGVMMVYGSLLMDSFIGILQEAIFKNESSHFTYGNFVMFNDSWATPFDHALGANE